MIRCSSVSMMTELRTGWSCFDSRHR